MDFFSCGEEFVSSGRAIVVLVPLGACNICDETSWEDLGFVCLWLFLFNPEFDLFEF